MLYSLLSAQGLPVWVTNSFPVLRQILMVLVFVAAVGVILITMFAPGESQGGTNVITGASESFYSKNKASSKEGRFKRLIILLSSFIAVAIVIYCVLTVIYGGI